MTPVCTWPPRRSSSARRARPALLLLALVSFITLGAADARAQYFGRNKVNYERFDFRVLPSEHFDLHFYPAESLATADAARMAERWYSRLSTLFDFTFDRNPLIFYADAPDFQQTNVVEGFIGEGTGGVTEGARDRVIMPFNAAYAETDHVLGHELVHVFQYRIAEQSRAGIGGMSRIPLWLIEGMAEYLSLGRNDPNTAMWLRDALRRDDLPTLKQLTTDPRYFPYRYGQALWAYIGGRYGDEAVNRLLRAAIERGWELGLATALLTTSDSLSRDWHAAIRREFAPSLAGRTPPGDVGREVVRVRDIGDQHVSPAVSPDGRYVAYFSSDGLFGIDLYMAEVATGRVIRQVTSVTSDRHFDALSFINSAGSWSPDGRKLAFIVYAQGDNEINIVDVDSRNIERRIRVKDVGAISDPAWSPDGTRIAFSGMKGGLSDLYIVDLAGGGAGGARQLTNDRAAQLQPAWSPDGRTIAFATDAGEGTSFDRLSFAPMRLALLDVASGNVRLLPRLSSGKAINPQFSTEGRSLYFVSDADGISDLYRMSLADGAVERLTRVATGVSGITSLSPAISVASKTGEILFSVFDKGGFAIRSLSAAQAVPVAGAVAQGGTSAGILPPAAALQTSQVERLIADDVTGLPATVATRTKPVQGGLSLDYIGGPSIGISTGGGYGTGLGGGVAFGFSDMLGNKLVNTVVQAQGSFKDIGAQALYLDRSRRWAWGIQAYHIPLAGVGARIQDAEFPTQGGGTIPGTVYTQVLQRVFFDNAQLLTQYPFSQTRRLEFSAGFQRTSFDTEVDSLYIVGNQVVRQARAGLPSQSALNFGTATAALVGDYSFFGFTSPVAGGRYRFEATPYIGDLNYQTFLADYRRYLFMRPLTFAVRALHFGRYGGNAESSRMQPLFVGQQQLIRGYDAGSFDISECTQVPGSRDQCPEYSRLNGSRIVVANAELRIPLFGTERFGLIPFSFLPLEIAPFVDVGAAWSKGESVNWRFDRHTSERVPVFSTGVTARFNLFGFAVGEVYWVRPYQRERKGNYFGFQLAPGW